ncbi:MAG TPA: PEGA domain-containing protein [Gemmata sp.]|jgi:hypothetical protein|nr:PEGA domain-containing protein [Gemmata sp.]
MMTGHTRSTLPWSRVARVVTVLALLVATGCVDRRFIIESNVPNAQVYIDNQPVGVAPAHASFDYYGHYNITIIHAGYETLTERVHVTSPWYGYPPFDFVTEVLWPFHIRDTRRYYFKLNEITKARVDDLINNADALRQRGYNLPIPAQPAAPKLPPGPIVQPQPNPTLPPVVPPVGPQPGSVVSPEVPQPGSVVPPVGSQPGPVVPQVGPSTLPSVAPPGTSGRP